MEPRRVILFVLLGLGLGFGGYWWSQPQTPSPDEEPETTAKSSGVVKHEVSGFNLVETTGPNEVWTLKAPKSTQEGDTMDLTDPFVTLRENGDTTATIRAKQGIYNTRTRFLTLKGRVRVRRPYEDRVLKTEVLNWDQSKGTIDTDEVVHIESPGRTLRAVGLWADLSEERVRFKSDVEVLSR